MLNGQENDATILFECVVILQRKLSAVKVLELIMSEIEREVERMREFAFEKRKQDNDVTSAQRKSTATLAAKTRGLQRRVSGHLSQLLIIVTILVVVLNIS